MWKVKLLTLMFSLACFLNASGNTPPLLAEQPLNIVTDRYCGQLNKIVSSLIYGKACRRTTEKKFAAIQTMLNKNNDTLSQPVINKTLAAIKCASRYHGENSGILTIIDFSLPSSRKRMWVFDLVNNKLLFHTYVSHGIKSGSLNSTYFSNRPNSKASSIGIYHTGISYFGRHGRSLKLSGLDQGFNDNAYRRFIVMHGSWYVNKKFIEKYGRAGRSWGCPSMPLPLTKPIINTIKDYTMLVVYYPGDQWLVKSKFLNCNKMMAKQAKRLQNEVGRPLLKEKERRGSILFVDKNKNNKCDVGEPIVAIKADSYQEIFNTKPPLKRMLRRQINRQEFIALNDAEFKVLTKIKNKVFANQTRIEPNSAHFVIPEVKKKRGYWATEMKVIDLGKVKNITLNTGSNQPENIAETHKVYFEKGTPVELKSTKRFIRWLGL